MGQNFDKWIAGFAGNNYRILKEKGTLAGQKLMRKKFCHLSKLPLVKLLYYAVVVNYMCMLLLWAKTFF